MTSVIPWWPTRCAKAQRLRTAAGIFAAGLRADLVAVAIRGTAIRGTSQIDPGVSNVLRIHRTALNPVTRSYAAIDTHYWPGDRLFVFGLSRGAAIARMLAHRLHKKGIPEQLIMTQDPAGQPVLARPEGRAHDVAVDFLGLFDTVASCGIPADVLDLPFQKISLLTDLTIAPNVAHALHLVSIDERRDPFTPTLVNHDPPRIEEVWFADGHSDAERRLADVSLRLMLDGAGKHGLRFTEDSLEELPANPLGLGRLHSNQESRLDTPPRLGVKRDGCWIRSVKPRIHISVFRRMDCLVDRYQPENVLELGGGYNVVE